MPKVQTLRLVGTVLSWTYLATLLLVAIILGYAAVSSTFDLAGAAVLYWYIGTGLLTVVAIVLLPLLVGAVFLHRAAKRAERVTDSQASLEG